MSVSNAAGAAPALVEVARRVFCAVGQELVERGLEGDGLAGPKRLEAERRIDRPIEPHRPDPRREELRVGRADERAIREPEVGQLRLAQGRPDPVKVTRDRVGREVGEVLGVALLAGPRVRLRVGHERGQLPRVVRGRVERGAPVKVVDAADRAARVDAARVEADQVEPLAELARERLGSLPDELDARAAGAAGIHDQRPNPPGRVGRREPDQLDGERAVARVEVVARHRDRGALEVIAAIGPASGRDRRLGKRGRRTGRRSDRCLARRGGRARCRGHVRWQGSRCAPRDQQQHREQDGRAAAQAMDPRHQVGRIRDRRDPPSRRPGRRCHRAPRGCPARWDRRSGRGPRRRLRPSGRGERPPSERGGPR